MSVLMGVSAVLTASSLISMMGVFMGSTSPDLRALLFVQAVAAALAVVIIAASIGVFVTGFGLAQGLRELWSRLPAWLIFMFVSVNSLVLAGELSYLLIHILTDRLTPWIHHVPLAAGLFGSLAFCLVYALASWKTDH